MFFQISPVRRAKQPKPAIKIPEPEKIEVLSFAPFAQPPKLFFNGIKIGELAICKLLLKNPTKQDITIFLAKKLPEELNVSYNWECKTLEKGSEVLFEITWKPSHQEASYHKISFESTTKLHRDVPIVFKTLSPKKSKTGKKKRKSPQKSPTKKYYATRPPNISLKKYSPSPKKNTTFQKTISPKAQSILSSKNENVDFCVNRETYFKLNGKENVSPVYRKAIRSENFSSSERYNFSMDYLNTKDERRQTYIFKQGDDCQDFDDSLELKSPDSFSKISTPQSFPKRLPLSSFNDTNLTNLTPDMSLGSYFKQKSVKPETPLNYGFEYKLTHLDSFCFTPVKMDQHTISPNKTSTVDIQQNLNLSSETYIKSNISSETYVKDEISFETYVKGNLSGGTYTKDSSVACLESISPMSLKMSPNANKFSPVKPTTPPTALHRPQVDCPINAYNNFTRPERQVLNPIQEESSFYYEKSIERVKPIAGLKKSWSKKGGTAFRISKSTSGLNITKPTNSIIEEKQENIVQIAKKDSNTIIIQNPFLLAATNLIDPFITSGLYISDEWLDQQEKHFKKWLNSLLTPPQELYSEDKTVDVAKVWQDCKKREVEDAPTKEEISNKYHINAKLNRLRKSAQNLFKSKEISTVLSKVVLAVDTGKLSIRQDKDVHLNISIKSDIMSMILSYNPLWLRIGLETIYNETIPLKSNSDVVGLSTFIINRLFKDPYLLKKYKSVHSPKYVVEFNKFFLKKFFILVYFLDHAKNSKLIPHNPCLFCKTATIKNSRDLLLMLARELLSAVGDVTKFLKFLGYVVDHVQTFIHEFDYAVKSLGVDLRDGVRLTRVMEIILMQENLIDNLRVPAISRLQKIHNMKLVFDSLQKAGYQILYDISPKDVVDGHREKTMSFLWQIIYKFEAPLMVKHATTIQKWFRSLPVILKRRKLQRIRFENENAACKIQKWYRRQMLSRKLTTFAQVLQHNLLQIKMERSVTKIQSFYRMYRQKKIYIQQVQTVREIQRLSRGWLIRNFYTNRIKSAVLIQSYVRMFLARKNYLKMKKATQIIEIWYLSKQQTKAAVADYYKLKSSTILLQRKWQAILAARNQRKLYKTLKLTTISIQRRFKANRLCKIEREKYQKIKTATIHIQNWYRSILITRTCRQEFLILKHTVLTVQKRYIALKIMKKEKETYEQLKKASTIIQQRYRAQKLMKESKTKYLKLRAASIVIQQRFRSLKLMNNQVEYFNSLKQAAIIIQRKFRANFKMKIERKNFNDMKNATLIIQRRWRSNQLAKQLRREYEILRDAAILIQQKWRAKQMGENVKKEYLKLKKYVEIIQTQWKANKLKEKQQKSYNLLKNSVIIIQRKYRATLKARNEREKFIIMKKATLTLQAAWRAHKEREIEQKNYQKLKQSALLIQQLWRAKIAAQTQRYYYLKIRKSTLFIQNIWRAILKCRRKRKEYETLRRTVVFIQQTWRAKIAAQTQRYYYLEIRKSTLFIQNIWRAILKGRRKRKGYETLKRTVVFIQQTWRAKRMGRITRLDYQNLKTTVVFIQNKWRCTILARRERQRFIRLKTSTVCIQRRWRALLLKRQAEIEYTKLRQAVLVIQRRYRDKKSMKIELKRYLLLKQITIVVQRRFRAMFLMKFERSNYLKLKNSALTIQRWYRSCLKTREERKIYLLKKQTAIVIQRFARGYLIRKKYAEYFTPKARESRRILKLKNQAATKIQSCWRGYKSRVTENPEFKKIRERYTKAKDSALPENTLQFKCDMALQTFIKENSTLFHINRALEDIDYATRRCKKLCIKLGNLLPDQLYILLSSMTRSLPEMHACILSVNILINFNKLEETKKFSFVPNYIDNLVTIMMHWCDKESQLFPSLCTLLWLFAHTPQWKRIILNLPNIKHKLEKIKSLVTRMGNMTKKKGVKATSVFSSYMSLRMPSRVPDWGLDYKNNPYVFTNSVHALHSLLSILNIITNVPLG